MGRYLVGIDLGTTNSALAYVDLHKRVQGGRPEIQSFAIPQLVQLGECKSRTLLPSFLYLPSEHEFPAGALALPWNPRAREAVGEFARQHGVRVPGRLVTSAKSWLCHAGVDRSARLLPWAAPPDVPRVSPVEASTRYLAHMVAAWNHQMAADKDENRLENLSVVLTVPASFDEVARNLTVAAAREAGLQDVHLLEEPQAAFYSWLATYRADELSRVRPGLRCLVIDVGGGTADFSLIRAVEEQGEMAFVREAVGDHLLLGGDNMDLALAKMVEGRLKGAGRLDAAQYAMLTQACRNAKEILLQKNPPESMSVAVMGRGRQVIGGSFHASITPSDVRQTILAGFFPFVEKEAEPARGARSGLHEMGLPYVSDPAITRHLAAFLRQHTSTSGGASEAPGAILFNGGVFQPDALRERLVQAMHSWFDHPGGTWEPVLLSSPSLDLAVAWGAAYQAWLRHTGGRRIGGGVARSYYIGVERNPEADSTKEQATPVLCVVPQHLQEGVELALPKPELELALGQPVSFPLFTSTVRGNDKAGDLLQISQNQLLRMPPLHTVLRGGKRSGTKRVRVTLAARATEIGTLELWCVSKESDNRWRLEFNVRDIVTDNEPDAEPSPASTAALEVWPEEPLQKARELLQQTYASGASADSVREVTRGLETALGARRAEWPLGLCRRLWDFLVEVADRRWTSPAHLGRWYHLVGYCLRPGFGDSLDRFRVEQLWKLVATPGRGGKDAGSSPARLPEAGADYWIMWRRAGAGLTGALQQALFDRLRPVLAPGKGKGAPRPNPNELAEMWRTAASLEKLDVKLKEALGQSLLKSLRRSPTPTYGFWSMTRIGARVLLYGPLNAVVHPDVVAPWVEAMLSFTPGHAGETTSYAFCLAQMARRSGQRALDLDEQLCRRVAERLRPLPIPKDWIRMVEEVVAREAEERSQVFGESLPIGLRLVES